MTILYIILWLAALICWGLAAFSFPARRINLIALGLLLAGLTFFLPLVGAG